jgi:hypothetical protein
LLGDFLSLEVKHMATQQTLAHSGNQASGLRLIVDSDANKGTESVGLADCGNIVQVSGVRDIIVNLDSPATCPGCRLSLLIVDKTEEITIGSDDVTVIMMSITKGNEALSTPAAKFVVNNFDLVVGDVVELWNNGVQWYGKLISGSAV